MQESRRSVQREKRGKECEVVESLSLTFKRDIEISVRSIENIDETKVKEITVLIEFNGATLFQSSPIPMTKSCTDLQLSTSIEVEDLTPQFLDDILANPVLFTVIDSTGPAASVTEVSSLTPSLDKESKKKPSKASNSSKSNSKTVTQLASNILGVCNLDIGCLATGKKIVRETLIVEPEKKLVPPDIIPWVKLPKLKVSASTGDEPLTTETQHRNNNIIGVTVESVYNFSSSTSEAFFFDAIIPVPSIGEKTRKIKFANGEVTTTKDPICRKKWTNLLNLQGRGGRCTDSVCNHYYDVFSDLPEDISIEKEVKHRSRIIEWNMWRSCLMTKSDLCYFYGKIMKYRVWPIEIVSSYKQKESFQKEKTAKSDKKSKPQTSKSVLNVDHYIAYLNLTPLLHPGVTSARIAAQLYTYSQSDVISKFGEDFLNTQSQGSLSATRNKSTSRSKGSGIDASEDKKNESETALYDEEGHPIFIIVEIELLKPITVKRSLEPLETNLRAYLSLRGPEMKKTSNLQLLKESFSLTIKKAVSILTDEYLKFSSAPKEENVDEPETPDVSFQKFLWTEENFFKIKSTLEDKVLGLITEKYGDVDQFKEKIPEIYVYLVNEMHRITNNCLLELKCVSSDSYKIDNYQLYAEEAIEEEDFDTAKDYLLSRISKDTSNPTYWLDCAVCCITLKKYEAAIEAVKEALCLDFNHQIGLLVFALLMALTKNGTLAETTFEILLTKYPEYVEGWMAFSLFYSIIANHQGEMVARKEANRVNAEKKLLVNEEEIQTYDAEKECKTYLHDMQRISEGLYGVGSIRNGSEMGESLSWTLSFCPPHNVNIKTTVLLQKLGFYEFAAMTLSLEMQKIKFEPQVSPSYMYYTCVNYYLQRRYEDAVLLLQDFGKEYGKDCFLWSLMGHCYYKLHNHSEAIGCYEYVIETYNRPDDIHLIYSRMGFYYIQSNKFECAKRVFREACKYSPTPKLWKGLGISFLRLEEFEQAEIAFGEANYLDNTDPDTWAYLGITNAMLRRLDLFQQCCLEAKKRGFKNSTIKKEIGALVLLNGLKGEEFVF